MEKPPVPQKTLAVILVLAVAFLAVFFLADEPVTQFRELTGNNPVATAVAFSFLMFISTVIAPITVFPIIPVTAVAIGSLSTALLSILAWAAGAIAAFLIARHFGRPILRRFVSLEEIDRYERLVPDGARFVWIVLLRMVLPVDVLSYALGLFSRMELWKYSLATLLGVAPFSFVLAYLGPAVVGGEVFLVLALGILLAVGASAGYFVWRWKSAKK